MKKYIEKIIPSQCRVINNETGYIHLEGESMILIPDGSYAGTVTTTIGSIRENHIDTVIEMLTNYKKKIASPKREQTIDKIITFDFRNKINKGGRP